MREAVLERDLRGAEQNEIRGSSEIGLSVPAKADFEFVRRDLRIRIAFTRFRGPIRSRARAQSCRNQYQAADSEAGVCLSGQIENSETASRLAVPHPFCVFPIGLKAALTPD